MQSTRPRVSRFPKPANSGRLGRRQHPDSVTDKKKHVPWQQASSILCKRTCARTHARIHTQHRPLTNSAPGL
eukprot:1153750-Pelagomonas_calceolata.AAC.1